MKKHNLTNIDVVIFVLYKLGGVTKKLHTEYIAWEAYQLTPERFSWENPEFKERGFPDKDIVRVTLTSARKKEYGSLVKGRAGISTGGKESDGWLLTPAGVKWIKENENRIALAVKNKSLTIHPREANRYLRKIRQVEAFLYFQKDDNLNRVSPYMFTDMLGCTPDASSEIITRKYERLLSTAISIGDKNTIEFLKKCRRRFSILMGEGNPARGAENESG